jgi:hypothetical protein
LKIPNGSSEVNGRINYTEKKAKKNNNCRHSATRKTKEKHKIKELNNHININNPRALLAQMMPLVE